LSYGGITEKEAAFSLLNIRNRDMPGSCKGVTPIHVC